MYALHQANLGDQSVSRSVLRRAFKIRWQKYITWRNDGQGKRCKVCAEIDERRSKATTPQEKEQANDEKEEHTGHIKEDRTILARLRELALDAAMHPTVDGFQQALNFVRDCFCSDKINKSRSSHIVGYEDRPKVVQKSLRSGGGGSSKSRPKVIQQPSKSRPTIVKKSPTFRACRVPEWFL